MARRPYAYGQIRGQRQLPALPQENVRERRKTGRALEEIVSGLPDDIARTLRMMPDKMSRSLEEIRFRAGRPVMVYAGGKEYEMYRSGEKNLSQEEVEKILDALKKINKILETSPTPDLQQKKLKLTRAKIEKDTRLNAIMKRKQETVDQMSKTNDASITILKRANPGTEITINGKHVSVQDEITGVEYRRRGTGIVSYGLE